MTILHKPLEAFERTVELLVPASGGLNLHGYGAAYVTIIIKGDVAAVTAALDAGAQAVGDLGKLIATQVIARPHEDLLRLLPA
ncbi:MAG: BMC domain-containing protein [Terrimicrobiaceae bacterium]